MADRLRRVFARTAGPLGLSLLVFAFAPWPGTAAAEPARVIGCQAAGASLRLSGPSRPPVVALTFDDGPSVLTPAIMDMLKRGGTRATFFVVGNLIAGRQDLLRRALAQGSALGNHSFTHSDLAGGGLDELAQAQAAIRAATGYTPCVFRAPMNQYSPLLIDQARSLGMNTVQWSVDSRDWAQPGRNAIIARVLGQVRPGAIVLLHDGGGNRQATLAALPTIIETLRAGGYRFVTVPELLDLAPRSA